MVKIINDLNIVISELNSGNIIAVPTETVYGLAADCQNSEAVAKIFKAKQRPTNHPLIIHASDYAMAQRYMVSPPEYVAKLAKLFWPGPLTMVLRKSDIVGYDITGGQETVAIRVPAHDLTRQVISQLGRGIVAPSANKFGHISPTTAEHVAYEFTHEFRYVLDGGNSSVGIESTIIDATNHDSFNILRPGLITIEQLQGSLGIDFRDNMKQMRVSGNLDSHYAPNKPANIYTTDNLLKEYAVSQNSLFICSDTTASRIKTVANSHNGIVTYSNSQDLSAKLYHSLRLGEASFSRIIIEQLPETLEWQALQDRISKAVFNYT